MMKRALIVLNDHNILNQVDEFEKIFIIEDDSQKASKKIREFKNHPHITVLQGDKRALFQVLCDHVHAPLTIIAGKQDEILVREIKSRRDQEDLIEIMS